MSFWMNSVQHLVRCQNDRICIPLSIEVSIGLSLADSHLACSTALPEKLL